MNLASITAPVFLRRAGYGDFLRYLAEAEAVQWKSSGEIQQLQWQRFHAILAHAAQRVPYYRDVFAAHGITPGSIAAPADLQRVPLLTKSVVQTQNDLLLTEGVDKSTLTFRRSSGSTGKPTIVYVDKDRANRSWGFNTRHNRWAGLVWGCKLGSMWGGAPSQPVFAKGLRGVRQRLMWRAMGNPREVHLNPYDYTDAQMQQFVEQLAVLRPDVLLGYANSLYFLAKHLQAAGIGGIRPRAIISGGESLDAEARRLLESVFASRVFLRYGSRETDIIASECEHGKLHVNDDNLLVEVLTDPGQPYGRVVITDLWNYAMPLIRYEIGDFASRSDQACACGRGLSVLAGVEGRSSEMFKTRDGRMVSGLWFNGVFREVPVVKRFQVRQTDYDAFHIRFTTDSSAAPDVLLADVFAKVRRQFGDSSRITVERTDEIVQEGSGKFRFLISDVR